MRNTEMKRIAQIGMLVAVEVVLSRFCSIITPIAKIGFAFLPIAVTGILYGPWPAGMMAVIADIIGGTLFPSGAFFPGFTLTAFLSGYTYGVFLHQRPANLPRIAGCVLVVQLFLPLGLNTVWLRIITGKAYLALLPVRAIQACVMIPIMTNSICYAVPRLFLVSGLRRTAQPQHVVK